MMCGNRLRKLIKLFFGFLTCFAILASSNVLAELKMTNPALKAARKKAAHQSVHQNEVNTNKGAHKKVNQINREQDSIADPSLNAKQQSKQYDKHPKGNLSPNRPKKTVKTVSLSRVEDCLPGFRCARPFDGWKISSTGGISYDNPKNPCYWMKFSGVLRVDQTMFSGDYRDKRHDFPNSGFLRLVETYLDSGLGEDWLSTIGLTFATPSAGHAISFTDTWIGYTGFAKNIEINIGRHSANWFGLEGSSGTTWNPFMERSLQNSAFYVGDGLGVLGDMWWTHGQITLIAIQSDHGSRLFTDGGRPFKTDRWKGLIRASYAPVANPGDVWHCGFSAAYLSFDSTVFGLAHRDERFRPWPGLRGRRIERIVDTGPIRASYANQFNVEAARQCGPFMLEAEYTQAFVHRKGSPFHSLQFNGYSIQTRYMLTGEYHEYDVRDGSFGKVDINSPCGAHEICLRYDALNLNNKDIRGGSQYNWTLGWNWFINQQVRFTFNYIRARIHPRQPRLFREEFLPRNLDMFGLRLQVRFK